MTVQILLAVCWVSVFQGMMVWSALADMRVWPSGPKTRLLTRSVCPVRVARRHDALGWPRPKGDCPVVAA